MVMYSICIPVYNEEESILNIASSVKNSILWKNTNKKELIFSLNGCTDNSEQIVRSIMKEDPFIKIIVTKSKSKHLALNNFLNQYNSKSRILFFIDADVTFEEDVLQKLYDCLNNNKVSIVGATLRYYPEKLNVWDFFKKRVMAGTHPKQTFIHGRCYAAKAKDMKEFRFPDSTSLYEDIYLTIKFKGKFKVIDNAIVFAKTPGFFDAVEQTIRDKIAYTDLREELYKTQPEMVKILDENRKEKEKRLFWWTKSKILKWILHIYTDYQYKKLLKNRNFVWKKLKSTKWKTPPITYI